MSDWTLLERLAVGLALGAFIGLERQWRQRLAGLRTNALVAAGATLFILLSTQANDRASPTRVAAQVVTGIGFLGAGVILRDGLSIRGLNTAATLWCSAAVGSLAGFGFFLTAAVGALGVVAVNLFLRPAARLLDRQPGGGAEVEATYIFRAVCREEEEAHIRALLVQSVSGSEFQLRGVHSEDTEIPGRVEVRADLIASARDDAHLEQAVSRLSLEPSVSAVTWGVLSDDEDDEVPAVVTGGPWRRSRVWLANHTRPRDQDW
jgi:putative Mg2+ transporter-C (MgtC) family protein